MRRVPVIAGIAAGGLMAFFVLALAGGSSRPLVRAARTGPVLSECDGAIRELVIQYVPEAADTVTTTYRQFLGQLPAEVTVQVVCPGRAAFDDLCRRVGPTACRLVPLPVGHAMTTWSRDRWIALTPAGPREPVTLWRPRGEDGAGHWPARGGDQRIALDLAGRLPGTTCRTSDLYFDGGDFTTDGQTVFVTPNVIRRNVQRTVQSRAELLEALAPVLKARVAMLETAPDHHAGMYMMCVGQRTLLVGDPAWARRLLDASGDLSTTGPPLCPPEGPDWSSLTQALFDAVARRCQDEGYRVVRIPVVPGMEARRVVTYVNAIIDQRAGQRTVYMPVYRGADPLNQAAAQVWRGLGYEVRTVDCTETYVYFGGLHCLVNVLRRA